MKKIYTFVIYIFITISIFGETNGQFRDRIGRMPDEWNSLCALQVKFQNQQNGEAYINLRNYMMGFAEAMYQSCEYLGDTFQGDYYKKYFYEGATFYFNEYQTARKDFGPGTYYYRSYFHEAGFNRVDKGSRRFTEYDFQ